MCCGRAGGRLVGEGALPGSSRRSGGVSGGVSAWDLVQPGPVGREGTVDFPSQETRAGILEWPLATVGLRANR